MANLVSLGAGEFSVSEEDSFLLVPLLRSGDLTGDVVIEFSTTEETATAGVDYRLIDDDDIDDNKIIIPEGEDRTFLRVEMIDDTLEEGTETTVVSIVSARNTTGLTTELGVPRTASISILDGESPPPPTAEDPVGDVVLFEENIVGGVARPIAFDWIPGRPDQMIVAAKSGLVQVFDTTTGDVLSTFVDLRDEVNNSGDRGVIDLALPPDFSEPPLVYLPYTVDPPAPEGAPEPQPRGLRPWPRRPRRRRRRSS